MVRIQQIAVRKLSHAKITLKWPFASVPKEMQLELILATKWHLASIALEQILLGMFRKVNFQECRVCKLLFANVTSG